MSLTPGLVLRGTVQCVPVQRDYMGREVHTMLVCPTADPIQHLLPVLRRVTEPVQAHSARVHIVRRTHLGFIDALLVVEQAHTLSFVTFSHLERWGCTSHEAWAMAMARLASRASEGLTHLAHTLTIEHDSCASSRALLPGWLDAFNGQVLGSPVAFAPAVDTLWIVGSEDPRYPEHAERAFQAFRTAARPLSPCAISPGAPPSPRSHALLEAFLYAEQAEALLETAPEGVYIAPLLLELTPSSHETSTTVEPGHECWLPRVDRVTIGSHTYSMHDLDLAELPLNPVRYRVEQVGRQ